uniref:Uncharacterized protein n=1 Tax=Xenopus tropicalis TaxID=8364 RepID=A0A803JHD3_XENTR
VCSTQALFIELKLKMLMAGCKKELLLLLKQVHAKLAMSSLKLCMRKRHEDRKTLLQVFSIKAFKILQPGDPRVP